MNKLVFEVNNSKKLELVQREDNGTTLICSLDAPDNKAYAAVRNRSCEASPPSCSFCSLRKEFLCCLETPKKAYCTFRSV